jgi:hypothetical protein
MLHFLGVECDSGVTRARLWLIQSLRLSCNTCVGDLDHLARPSEEPPLYLSGWGTSGMILAWYPRLKAEGRPALVPLGASDSHLVLKGGSPMLTAFAPDAGGYLPSWWVW